MAEQELVNDLQDKPEGLDVSVLPTGSVAGLPVALHPYGFSVHIAAAMPAYVSVPFPRSLVYRLAHRALLARVSRIDELHPYAVPLALVDQLVLKIGV